MNKIDRNAIMLIRTGKIRDKKDRIIMNLVRMMDSADWEEEKHPRDKSGQFTEKGSGEGTATKTETEKSYRTPFQKEMDDLCSKIDSMDKNQVYDKLKEYDAPDELIMDENGGYDGIEEAAKQFFTLLGENGYTSSGKEEKLQDSTKYDDAGKLDRVMEDCGVDEDEAQMLLSSIEDWTGNDWNMANTDDVDSYIDLDGVYSGEIYRGISLPEEEYNKFIKNAEPGGIISSRGVNASWTDDRFTANSFSSPAKMGHRGIVLVCFRNRTSAPIKHLSVFDSESEVVSHSAAQWMSFGCKKIRGRMHVFVAEMDKRNYAQSGGFTNT